RRPRPGAVAAGCSLGEQGRPPAAPAAKSVGRIPAMSADAPGIRPFRSADLERIRQITVESFEGVSIDRNIEAQFGQVAGRDWRERKARDVMVDCEVNPEGVFVAEIDGEVAGYVTTRIDRFSGIGRIPN